MFKLADRVKQTTLTEGNGLQINFADTFGGFQSFAEAIGDGNTTYYTIENGVNFEVGVGTYTLATNSLSRDEVLTSSNNNNRVNLVGLSIVFCSYPASKVFLLDSQGFATAPDGTYIGITLPDGTIITSNVRHYRTLSTNATILNTDDVIFANCSSNNINVTLPLASDVDGKTFTFKLIESLNSQFLTISSQGSNLIDGRTSVDIKYKYASLTLVSLNSNWYII